MTCGFCKYEFCWARGESASSADNHFGLTRGCGVKMMDDTVKPRSMKMKERTKYDILKAIGKVIGYILAWPFFMVGWMPIMMVYGMKK